MGNKIMIRGFVLAVVTAALVGIAPAADAAPLSSECIAGKMNANGTCYYANCSEADADGACGFTPDDPRYCQKQDRDDDGVACEC